MYKIDYEKIKKNISNLDDSDYIILKSNAYGFGFKEVLDIAISMGNYKFAVIDIDYAIFIKKHHPDTKVLLMGPICKDNIVDCEKYEIEITINKLEDIGLLYNYDLKVQIEINCGMNRFGIRPDDITRAINLIKESNLKLTGVYGHNATNDYLYTINQLEAFYYAIKDLKDIDIHFSSSTLMKRKILNQTARRIGQFIYKDALTVYGNIVEIIKVYKDEFIGYDYAYQFKNDSYVGIVNIGYADGLERNLEGYLVWIKDKYYPMVGKACMNYCFVLLDSCDLLNEEAVFIGKNNNIKKYEIFFDKIPHQIYLSFLKSC